MVVLFGWGQLIRAVVSKSKTIDAMLELYAAIVGWLTDRIPRKNQSTQRD